MKLFFSYQANEVIWPDYINDFLEASTPVKFIEHVPGCGFGLGTYPYEPTDKDSDLRDYGGKIYVLTDVDECDGLLMIDGEVYEENDGLVYEVEG